MLERLQVIQYQKYLLQNQKVKKLLKLIIYDLYQTLYFSKKILHILSFTIYHIYMSKNMVTHLGGCHCKQIQFEVLGEENIQILNCTCSICSIVNYKHYIVDKSKFKLIKGKDIMY